MPNFNSASPSKHFKALVCVACQARAFHAVCAGAAWVSACACARARASVCASVRQRTSMLRRACGCEGLRHRLNTCFAFPESSGSRFGKCKWVVHQTIAE
eukprot:3023215-Alexandrium_andersonii.AAC.1